MDRHSILVDAVRKMLSLKMSEADIMKTLAKEISGVDLVSARKLIDEAKKAETGSNSSGTETVEIDPSEIWLGPEGLPESPAPAERVSSVASRAETPSVSSSSSGVSSSSQTTASDSGPNVWESSILVTVNQRLDEMRQIRAQLDAMIDQKVAASNEREMQKFRVLLDSQRALLLSRLDTQLEAKTKDLTDLINARIKELQSANSEISTAIAGFRQERDSQRQFVSDFKGQLADLSSAREKILSEVRTEISKMRAENDAMNQAQRKQMEVQAAQINKLLELQSKMAEGLVQDANRKIQVLADTRFEKIEQTVNERLAQNERTLDQKTRAFEAAFDSETKARQAQFDELLGLRQVAQELAVADRVEHADTGHGLDRFLALGGDHRGLEARDLAVLHGRLEQRQPQRLHVLDRQGVLLHRDF